MTLPHTSHWDDVYRAKSAQELSWFQASADTERPPPNAGHGTKRDDISRRPTWALATRTGRPPKRAELQLGNHVLLLPTARRRSVMTPRERKDMPRIIGAFVALGGHVCGALIYRLLM